MFGSVSATVAGWPVLFTLRDDLIWEVDRPPGLPDDALVRPIVRLMDIVEMTRPGGPCPVHRAAEAIGGIPCVPQTE